jgi:hypothetical protein
MSTNKGNLMITSDASWLAVPEAPGAPAVDVTQAMYGMLEKWFGTEEVQRMKTEIRKAGSEFHRKALQ